MDMEMKRMGLGTIFHVPVQTAAAGSHCNAMSL